MKKTLIAFAAAAALTTSAFAEITFGAWLRVLTAPVASDGDETRAVMTNSWGWGARPARIGVNAVAEDGKIGYDMIIGCDINGKDMGLTPVDQARIWAKPVDAVTLSMGKYDKNELRGDCAYGSWNWLRPTSSWIQGDEGLLMSGNGGTGLLAEITPIEGLYIHALIPTETTAKKAEDVYKNARAGFAYTIDGIGKIKAQFIGDFTAKTEAKAASGEYEFDAATGTSKLKDDAVKAKDANFNKTLEAEFDLTAVENLWLGLGFQYKMNDKKSENPKKPNQAMKVALGAKYQATDMIGLSASAAFFTFDKLEIGNEDIKVDPRFQAGAGVDAAVADGVNVSADVRYLSAKKVDGTKEDNSDHIAFSVGVTKNISSNGYIGAAFQAQTNGGEWGEGSIMNGFEDKLSWCVPVAISCWF